MRAYTTVARAPCTANLQVVGDNIAAIEIELVNIEALRRLTRPKADAFVGSSMQFMIRGVMTDCAAAFLGFRRAQGIEPKWFGADEPIESTSHHSS